MGIPIDTILDLVILMTASWLEIHFKPFKKKLSRLRIYTRVLVHVYVCDDAHQIQRKKRILCWIELKSEVNSNQIR